MIWSQLQNLIAQQRNFLIQTLITERNAQINAEIAAKVKEAKTFKCTFKGTTPLLFHYKINFYFSKDAIKTTAETFTYNLTFADRILEKSPKNVTGQVKENKKFPKFSYPQFFLRL